MQIMEYSNMMGDNFCLYCAKETDIVLDHEAGGDRICSECGCLLLEHDQTDAVLRWGTSSGSVEKESEDTNRNPDFEICSLSTTSDILQSSVGRGDHNFVRKPPKRGYRLIGIMADRLGLMSEIKDRGREIYNKVNVLRTCRGRSLDSILAACLFIACRELRLPITLKELSDVASGVPKKRINRAIESIKKQFEVETGTVQPRELVKRFCCKLGMENLAIKAVQEALRRTEEVDIRRSPRSVLAALIYMVIQLSQDKVPVKAIAIVTELTELTIRKSYKDISPYGPRLIPDWFAREEEIMNIPSP